MLVLCLFHSLRGRLKIAEVLSRVSDSASLIRGIESLGFALRQPEVSEPLHFYPCAGKPAPPLGFEHRESVKMSSES